MGTITKTFLKRHRNITPENMDTAAAGGPGHFASIVFSKFETNSRRRHPVRRAPSAASARLRSACNDAGILPGLWIDEEPVVSKGHHRSNCTGVFVSRSRMIATGPKLGFRK